jgi:hypothetical protein
MNKTPPAGSKSATGDARRSRSRLRSTLSLLFVLLSIAATLAPSRVHLTWSVLLLLTLAALISLHDNLRRWSAELLALSILFALGIAHGLFPQKFVIDWPGAVLFLLGITLLLLPLIKRLLPFVESVEVGNTKLKIRKLDQSVTEAEVEAETEAEQGGGSHSAARNRFTTLEMVYSDIPPGSISIEAKVLDLAVKDKYSALLRLGIEVEKELANLQRAAGGDIPSKGISWSAAIRDLHAKGLISDAISQALFEFRDVRNRVIHATREGSVSEQLASSAIDSGLRLYRLLSAISVPERKVREKPDA